MTSTPTDRAAAAAPIRFTALKSYASASTPPRAAPFTGALDKVVITLTEARKGPTPTDVEFVD